MRTILLYMICALALAAAGCDEPGGEFPERAGSPAEDAPDVPAGAPEDAVEFADLAAARNAIAAAAPDSAATQNTFAVRSVIDGDTILLDDGRKIRYIGIDAPERAETAEGRAHPAEPYSDEATAFNRRLVEGRRVLLVFDDERTDIYGRALAYVFALPAGGDGVPTFVNAEMILAGFALAARYAPNLARAEMFTGLEELAAREKSGLWQTTPSGYVGSTRSKIFHRRACLYGQKIKPANAVFFDTRRQALAAGYRPCRVCRP